MAFGALVSVQKHLCRGIRGVLHPHVDGILVPRFVTTLVPPARMRDRRRVVVRRNPAYDFVEQRGLKLLGTCHSDLRPGVLRFEVRDNGRVLALSQPVVFVDARDPVVRQLDRPALRARGLCAIA